MKKPPINPKGDRVLVEVEPPEKASESGLLLPESAQKKTQTGTILRVGNSPLIKELDVKVGERALYGKYYGTDIKHKGKQYRVLRVTEIFATFEDE